jgi:predicted porin
MKALKTLLAAAVIVALPVAGIAQTPPAEPAKPAEAAPAPAAKPATPIVTVYGTLNVNLQYTEAGDATVAANDVSPRASVSIDSSNVGVRGGVDVSHGLKAVYQCETAANIDGEGVAGLCNRNSRLGLSGGFGTLWYGNWDTPYKAGTYGTKAEDPFGNTDVFGFQGLMGSPGYGVRSGAINGAAGNVAGFDLRAGNSVGYWSPKVANLVSFKIQWGVDEFRTAEGTVDPMLLSGVLNLDMGGLSVVAQAEYHEDWYGLRVINAANAGTPAGSDLAASKDLALRFSVGYELPVGPGALTVNGMVERLSYGQDNAAAGFEDYERLSWLVGAKFRAGPHEFRARYTQALDPDITAATGALAAGAEDDLAAQQFTAGYAYHLGKSTQMFLYYSQILNEDRARYTFGVSGNATVVAMGAAQAGADPLAIGLGFRQAF